MQRYRQSLYVFKLSVDLFILSCSFLMASLIARKRTFPKENFFTFDKREFVLLLALCIVWYLSSKASGLYDDFRSRTLGFELISILNNCLVQLTASIVAIFIIKTIILSRFFILLYFFFQLILLSVAKFILRTSLQWLRAKGHYVNSLLILGAGKVGRDFFTAMKSCPHLGYETIGLLDDKPQTGLGNLYLGSLEDLNDILTQKKVDEVIIALPNYAVDKIEKAVSICEIHAISPRIIPDYFRFLSHNFTVSIFGYFPVISLKNPLEEIHWRLLKRVFDTAITLVLFLLLFVWLWPIIAIAIKVDSRGPVFFKQEHGGYPRKFRRNRGDC